MTTHAFGAGRREWAKVGCGRQSALIGREGVVCSDSFSCGSDEMDERGWAAVILLTSWSFEFLSCEHPKDWSKHTVIKRRPLPAGIRINDEIKQKHPACVSILRFGIVRNGFWRAQL